MHAHFLDARHFVCRYYVLPVRAVDAFGNLQHVDCGEVMESVLPGSAKFFSTHTKIENWHSLADPTKLAALPRTSTCLALLASGFS